MKMAYSSTLNCPESPVGGRKFTPVFTPRILRPSDVVARTRASLEKGANGKAQGSPRQSPASWRDARRPSDEWSCTQGLFVVLSGQHYGPRSADHPTVSSGHASRAD